MSRKESADSTHGLADVIGVALLAAAGLGYRLARGLERPESPA
jgi:hypothetical protein